MKLSGSLKFDPACGSGIFLVESFKRLVKRWKNAHLGQQIF